MSSYNTNDTLTISRNFSSVLADDLLATRMRRCKISYVVNAVAHDNPDRVVSIMLRNYCVIYRSILRLLHRNIKRRVNFKWWKW